MLIVTPSPAEIESLDGYLLRLAEANGYPGPSYVGAMMTGRWESWRCRAMDATPLIEIAGLTPTQVSQLTAVPESGKPGYKRFRGVDLPPNEVSIGHPKICPACLAEHGRCDAFWDLTQAAACPIHHVRLIGTCPRCLKNLSWNRKRVLECKCGADLTRIEAPEAPDSLVALMGVMRHFVHHGPKGAPFPAGMQHLQHLGLARLCKLFWMLSREVRRMSGVRPLPKARHSYEVELEVVAQALRDWPHGFRQFLSDVYERRLAGTKASPRFRWMFGWLFNGLIAPELATGRGDASVYDFLVEEVCRFGSEFWLHTDVCSPVDRTRFPIHARWGSRLEAATLLGIRLVTLNKLVKEGAIPTRKVSGSHHRSLAIDLDVVRNLAKPNNRSTVDKRRAAKQIGLSISTLREIRRNNLCGLSPRLTFPDRLDKHEIESLITRFAELAAGKRSMCDESAMTVGRAFIEHCATARERAMTFDLLLSHPSWVVGHDGSGTRADKLQLAPSTVKRIFGDFRNKYAYVSCADAAKRLNCSYAVIVALKRQGHLKCGRHAGRLRPTAESVRAFERTYEAAASVAKRVGVGCGFLYSQLDFARVRHLRIQSLQFTTVFIHRAEVPRMEARLKTLTRGDDMH